MDRKEIMNSKKLFLVCVLSATIVSCSSEGLNATDALNSVSETQQILADTRCDGEIVSEEKYLSQFPSYRKGQTWIYDIKISAISDDNQIFKKDLKYLLGVLDVKTDEMTTIRTENKEIINEGEIQESDYIKHRISSDTIFSIYKPKSKDTLFNLSYLQPEESLASLALGPNFDYSSNISRTIYRVGDTTAKLDGQDYPTQHYCIKSGLKDSSLAEKSYLSEYRSHFDTQKHVWLSPQVGIIKIKLTKKIEMPARGDFSSDVTLKTYKPGTGVSYGVYPGSGGLYEVFPGMDEVENLEGQFNRNDEQELSACTSGAPSEIGQVLKMYPEPQPGQTRRYAYVQYTQDKNFENGRPSIGLVTYNLTSGAELDFTLLKEEIKKNYPNVPASKTEESRELSKENVNSALFDPTYDFRLGQPEKVFRLGTETIKVNGTTYDTEKYCIQSTQKVFRLEQSQVYVGWFHPGTGLIKSVSKLSGLLSSADGGITQFSQIQ